MSTATTEAPGRSTPEEPRIPAGQAAGISVLAFAAAVGVGHLVAGVVSPLSSPYQAVADTVVRIAPAPLVEFGKSLAFPGLPQGKADKVGLLLGVGVALVLVAVIAGLASRRTARPGRMTVGALGLVGLAAVVFSPVFTLPDVVAPLASVGAGLWSFRWLHEKAYARALGPNTFIEDLDGVSRRDMLISSAAVGVGAAGAGIGGYLLGAGVDITGSQTELAPLLRPTQPAPPIPEGADFVADGTPTFLTANQEFYRIDTALRLPAVAARSWSMRIHGMVDRELTITYADLLRRPLVERVVTLACVSNEVGGSLISTARFIGVDLRDLLVEAGVQPGAQQLYSTSLDGWTAGTPVDVVMEPDRGSMLALGMNGDPLPLEHGYPVRMVVPGLYGFVSATKWLADLELTTFQARSPYWLDRGWARFAPIKTESRIDKPRGFESVPAGQVTVAGIAWAQHRGVSKVEVRVDGGPWQQAQLATEVNRDSWRMWRAELTVPPGDHLVESRATDGTGAVQTALRADPVPDGASGWPIISFSAA
ncbi:molybdopterin-dependent oxidoreductase [Pseudonocardia spinosispora]|uniref:molybdopterin-dependent oxidoreductase n=1 Tax=Pseudonocardia spinosispora TaxID=103441 RepID=UPI000563770B|nr:molybdopterin-dependent oxidoreductase [Pseudonocardia spinosispora]